jgi:sugar phosphate isomerase/epimerase
MAEVDGRPAVARAHRRRQRLGRDEHLVPGRGEQPCAELLEGLAGAGFDGLVIAEINTRKCDDRAEREADLAEALAFTRLHLAAPAMADTSSFKR